MGRAVFSFSPVRSTLCCLWFFPTHTESKAMRMRDLVRFSPALLAGLGSMCWPARAADALGPGVVAFKNCRILTAAGSPIERGVLVEAKGKIQAVGSADETPIPEHATVRDLAGKTVI